MGRETIIRRRIRERRVAMIKQKMIGAAIAGICVAVSIVASQGEILEDMTGVFLFLGLGISLIFTRKRVIF